MLPRVRSTFRRRTFRWWLVAVLIIFNDGRCAWTEEPASQSSREEAEVARTLPRQYRRVYVPADHLDAWPREGRKFLPIDAKEFDSLIESANGSHPVDEVSATIESAEYTGALNADGVLSGRASWRITHRGGRPAFIRLSAGAPTVRNAHWRDKPTESVRMGLWGGNENHDAAFGLEVPFSGTLEFEWTARPQLQSDGYELPWNIPSSSTRLVLDLADGQVARLDHAVVLQSDPIQEASQETQPLRRWVLVHGPSTSARLRVTNPRQSGPKTVEQLSVRCATDYQVERRGLEIRAEWKLQGNVAEQRELTFQMPVGVQLASLRVNGQDENWRISAGTTAEFVTVVVPLPDNSNSVQTLNFTAWQPLNLEQTWRLPSLRPMNVFWSSGRIRLRVSSEFELKRLNAIDGSQTEVTQLSMKSPTAEVFSFAAFSAAATLETVLSLREPDATVRMGSSLALSDPDVTGRLVSEWSVSRSSVHRMSGQLAAGWNVEAVETVPAEALAEWFIDRRNGQRKLEIRLTEAVTTERNVSVIVAGRLPRFNVAEPISADVLRMVRWTDARVTRHLFSFQTTDPYVFEPVGKAAFLQSDRITGSELALLDTPADRNRILDLSGAGPSDGLRLAEKRGQYTADIQGELACLGSEARTTWKIAVVPKSGAIERLHVYATAPLGDTARWIERASNVSISAELVPLDASSRTDLPRDGELWLLRLPRPAGQAINLELTTTQALSGKHSLALLSLPDASDQSGRVIVRAPLGTQPAVQFDGLTPVPRAGDGLYADAEALLGVQAFYQFSPRNCWDVSRAPRFEILPARSQPVPAVVINDLKVDSYFGADGRTLHRAQFELHNYGGAEFIVALPALAKLSAAYLNGRNLNVANTPGGAPLSIQLASGEDTAMLALFFETQDVQLLALRTLVPPIRAANYPILSGEWTAWLPEGLSIACKELDASQTFNWRQRLFGFLAAEHNARFNPLRAADWTSLFNGIADAGALEPDLPTFAPPAAIDSRVISAVTTAPLPGMTSVNLLPMAAAAGALKAELLPTVSASALVGWRPVQQRFVTDNAPLAIVAYRPATINAWAVACMAAGFLFGCWIDCKLRYLILGMFLAGGLAMVLPTPFAPLGTGLLWGLVCSVAIRWLRHSKLRTVEQGSPIARTSTVTPSLLLGVIFVGSIVRGQTIESNTQRSSQVPVTPPIERVFIPIDEHKQSVGTKVFVSDEFLRALLGAKAGNSKPLQQWVINGAVYTGELNENRGQADVVAGNWSLALEIETFVRHATVQLPLVRHEASWQATAMLEGVPTPLRWTDDGRGCKLNVAEPGRYVLTLFCAPNIGRIEGGGEVRLTIPQIPLAKISLRVPDRLADLRMSTAVLARATKDSPGLRTGELFQAKQIHTVWSTAEPKSAASPGLSVSEFNWLRIEPHGIELETKIVVEGGARRPESLTIQYEDRWELISPLPSATDGHRAEKTNHVRTLQLPLPNDDIDRQELTARWKLLNAPEVGNIRVRPIAVTTTAATQRWFAISTNPTIECAAVDNQTNTATAKEFQTKWGEGAPLDAPQIVLANVDPATPLLLSLRPREASPAIRETLHLSVGRSAMRVLYQADVAPGTEQRFQFKLDAPEDLVIDEITVAEADRQIPTRWSRDDDGRCTIFLGDVASSDYRLTVSGTMPIKSNSPISLPKISAVALPPASQQVQLYRDDEVGARIENAPRIDETRTVSVASLPIRWLVRPLGSFPLNEATARDVRIIAAPNDAVVRGDALTSIFRDEGRWWAVFRARVFADHADLDVLKIELPLVCSGPFEVTASIPITTEVTGKNADRQMLVARLSSSVPIGQSLDVELRTPLAFPPGASPFVPNIEVAKFVGHRYLSVPTKIDSQPIVWSDLGVQKTVAPELLLRAQTSSVDVTFLEVVKNPFDVAIRSQVVRQPAPAVRLAESCVSLGKRGGQVVVSHFVVAPDGTTSCILKLPPDQQFLAAELDDQPALVTPIKQSDWQVQLASPALPQVVTVRTWLKESNASETAHQVLRPSLYFGEVRLPVELSIWEVIEVAPVDFTSVADTGAVDPVDLAALRFDRLISIAETATTAVTDLPPENRLSWLRSWEAILKRAEQKALAAKSRSLSPRIQQYPRTSAEQVELASQRFDRWHRSFSMVPKTINNSALRPLPEHARDVTNTSGPAATDQEVRRVTSYVFDGDTDLLNVQDTRSGMSGMITQLSGVIVVMGLALLAIWGLSLPATRDILVRWPQAIGVVGGLFYWAFLWPSWLGLILVAISMWLGVRSSWPGHTIRPEASTVLRSTRTLQP